MELGVKMLFDMMHLLGDYNILRIVTPFNFYYSEETQEHLSE